MAIDTNLDRVRLLVGDTDEQDPLLTDEEVESFVNSRAFEFDGETVYNVQAAAADAAAAIAAKFARDFNFSEDGQRFDRAQRVSHYLALETTLRSRAGGVSVPVSES